MKKETRERTNQRSRLNIGWTVEPIKALNRLTDRTDKVGEIKDLLERTLQETPEISV